jgi:hypothetical protein
VATLVGGEAMTLLECVGAVVIALAAILEATGSPVESPQPTLP